MVTIGLTGGIGVGKTYIAEHFKMLGIPVYNADDEAKKLYDEPTVINELYKRYGDKVVKDGVVDFSELGAIIFQNDEEKRYINALIHPKVIENFQKWKNEQCATTVMMESAIIYEANFVHFFDKIVVVDAPLETRIARIEKRNPNLAREEILQRIECQINQEEKCSLADWVIRNF